MSKDQKIAAITNVVACYVGVRTAPAKSSYFEAHVQLQSLGVSRAAASKILAAAKTLVAQKRATKH